MSVQVHVNTFVSPFKDLYKSAHWAHCIVTEYYFEIEFMLSYSLSFSPVYTVCSKLSIKLVFVFCCYPVKPILSTSFRMLFLQLIMKFPPPGIWKVSCHLPNACFTPLFPNLTIIEFCKGLYLWRQSDRCVRRWVTSVSRYHLPSFLVGVSAISASSTKACIKSL